MLFNAQSTAKVISWQMCLCVNKCYATSVIWAWGNISHKMNVRQQTCMRNQGLDEYTCIKNWQVLTVVCGIRIIIQCVSLHNPAKYTLNTACPPQSPSHCHCVTVSLWHSFWCYIIYNYVSITQKMCFTTTELIAKHVCWKKQKKKKRKNHYH